MEKILENFEENIERARRFIGIYSSIKNSTTNILDVSDVLRSGIVMGVSAFDKYVHEIVKEGMVQALSGERPKTNKYEKFKIPLKYIPKIKNESDGHEWFRALVDKKHSYKSFQDPNKANQALRLVIDVNNVWDEIARGLDNKDGNNLRERMGRIVDRRNKIAHESDRDTSKQSRRWPIDQAMVEDSLQFIGWSGRAIHDLVSISEA